MAKTTDEIRILVKAEVSDAIKKMKKLTDTNKKQTSALGKLSKGYGVFAALLTGVVVVGLTKVIKKAIDFEESVSKFAVVFRGVEKEAQAMVKTLNDGFGLSSAAATRLLADTGDLLAGFGFTRKETLALSSELAVLGSDLASFTNIEGGAEEAVARLTKALGGEAESLKALGIVIRQDSAEFKGRVKALQEEEGLTITQARAKIILADATRQSANAQGDFARTQGNTANQIRIFKNNIEDLAVEIGTKLLPFVNAAVVAINDFFAATSEASKQFREFTKANDAVINATKRLADEEAKGAENSAKIAIAVSNLTQARINLSIETAELERQEDALSRQVKIGNAGRAELVKQQKAVTQELKDASKEAKDNFAINGKVILGISTEKVEILKRNTAKGIQKNLDAKVNELRSQSIDLQDKLNELGDREAELDDLKNKRKVEGLRLEKELLEAKIEAGKEGAEEEVELEKVTQEEIVEIAKSSANEQEGLIKALAEKRIDSEKKITEAVMEETERRKEAFKQIFDAVNDGVQAGFDVFSAVQSNRVQLIENEKQALRDKVHQGLISEEEFAKGIEGLNKKRAAALRKQFISEKVSKILQIASSTALGIVNVWKEWAAYPIVAGVLSGVMGTIGAVNTGIVASQQPPAFPHGGSFISDGPQSFIAGDTPNGRERITVAQQPGIINNDNSSISGDTIFNVMANNPIELTNEIEKQGYRVVRD